MNDRTLVGLDVHAGATWAATLDLGSGELACRRLVGRPREAVAFLEGLRGSVLAVYEAGPVGYGLARAGAERAVEVRVCAPGSVPRRRDRVKTDRRDAERLVRLLAAGELSFVRVPSVEEERFRDLARAREAARADLMRARHRLSKFLARREVWFPGPGSTWRTAHWRWLRSLHMDDRASQVVFEDYQAGVALLEGRRATLDREITGLCPQSPWAATVARLRCLRGIDTVSAFGICAELGELRRFARPHSLAAYLGIVPSEYSSGETRKQGPITKAGSPYARRLLVEAAHHYRHQPLITPTLRARQHGIDPRACEISWRCQRRLHQQWQRLRLQRHKPGNVTIVALARELATFIWEIGQLD